MNELWIKSSTWYGLFMITSACAAQFFFLLYITHWKIINFFYWFDWFRIIITSPLWRYCSWLKILLELANNKNWAYSIDGAISIKSLTNVTFNYTARKCQRKTTNRTQNAVESQRILSSVISQCNAVDLLSAS